MNLNTVLERMPYWYLSNQCAYLVSPPGRGKTTTVMRAPEIVGRKLNKNLGIVIINGGLLTPMDVLGYGVPKHYENHTEMVFSDPFFWRTAEGKRLEQYDGGVIFIDEADKADVDVKKVVGEGALSGRFGPHRLPPGWVVWMAGNRTKDRSGSTKELDHLINRRRAVEITDDLKSLVDWMDENGAMPLTKAFTTQNPHIVFEDPPKDQGPWCTPRSLMAQDVYLQILAKDNNDEIPVDPTTVEEIAGGVGMGAAQQLFGFVKLEREMPKYEKIIRDPTGVKVPDKPDAQMLVCYNLAARVVEDEATPVIKYLERMPKEFAVTFVTSVCKRMPKAITWKPFFKWSMENSSLVAVLQR